MRYTTDNEVLRKNASSIKNEIEKILKAENVRH